MIDNELLVEVISNHAALKKFIADIRALPEIEGLTRIYKECNVQVMSPCVYDDLVAKGISRDILWEESIISKAKMEALKTSPDIIAMFTKDTMTYALKKIGSKKTTKKKA